MVKKPASHAMWLVSILILSAVLSCSRKESIDFSSMHVYKPEEIDRIIENAVKIEKVGEPTVQKAENAETGTITTVTSQVYRVYVARGEDDHLVPPSEGTAAARAADKGPIVITTACQMMCTRLRPDEPCHISGCMESSRCGCTQGSCGDNCTTSDMCKLVRAGFGFGKVIMF